MLSENYLLLGKDSFHGQIPEHISMAIKLRLLFICFSPAMNSKK